MTNDDLTDFFAGLAMVGLLPREDLTNKPQLMAKYAYERADAMMEERKRRDYEERTSC
jgi:hypothetical protein